MTNTNILHFYIDTFHANLNSSYLNISERNSRFKFDFAYAQFKDKSI